jgi:hypothetical protein
MEDSPEPDVGRLQRLLLDALVTGRPLPGAVTPLQFADVRFLSSSPDLLVSSRNLAGPMDMEVAGHAVRVVDESELDSSAAGGAEVAYVQFTPHDVGPDTIRLGLEIRLRGSPGRQPLGLEGVQATFRRGMNGWTLAGEPARLAL